MAILCPGCGREYDVTLFQFGRYVTCECGRLVGEGGQARGGHTMELGGEMRLPQDRAGQEELARGADRIVDRIMEPEYPRIDILLACDRLRERAAELFPGRDDLFALVYEARFARLYQQFRGGNLWEGDH